MGFISPDVDAISAGRNHDLYLLTDVDIPFVQDGTRDGERIRHAMHKRFMEELTKRSKPFEVLSGTPEQRVAKAIALCDSILTQMPVL